LEISSWRQFELKIDLAFRRTKRIPSDGRRPVAPHIHTSTPRCTLPQCASLHHTASYFIALPVSLIITHINFTTPCHPSPHCTMLHHNAPHRIMLYYTAPCCTLHHDAPHCTTLPVRIFTRTRTFRLHYAAVNCTTLHHAVTHCIALHRTACHCTTLHHIAPYCR